MGADYSSVLVRQHAGTRGVRRRADPACAHRGARSAQGRSSVVVAGASVRRPGGFGGSVLVMGSSNSRSECRRWHQAPLMSGTSRNTQPKLTQPVKSLRGKITYALGSMSLALAKILDPPGHSYPGCAERRIFAPSDSEPKPGYRAQIRCICRSGRRVVRCFADHQRCDPDDCSAGRIWPAAAMKPGSGPSWLMPACCASSRASPGDGGRLEVAEYLGYVLEGLFEVAVVLVSE